MPKFIIAGRADCAQYVQALKVAHFLEQQLPDIKIEKKDFLHGKWRDFLHDINESNRWFITKSPVIWKEISVSEKKPHLIGGLSEFWEYIDDYYGLKNYLDKITIEELRLENFENYHEKEIIETELKLTKTLIIGFYGFNNKYAQMLLPEIFYVPNLITSNDIIIKIYDQESITNPNVEEEIETIIEGYLEEIVSHIKFRIKFIGSLTELIKATDILLITEDYLQQESEDKTTWLERCGYEMSELGDELNKRGKKQLKIICSHLGPVCFTATALLRSCRFKRTDNIVAITSHEGLKVMNSISKTCDIPISELGAPPVWGFVGLDHFIDVNGVIVMQEVVRPYKRALKNIEHSTLPQRKVNKELRLLSCNINRKKIENDSINRCNKYQKLGRVSILPLLRATLHFLELWHSVSDNDAIISLGVCSTGAFGIPENIVFSQPVTLDDEGVWRPFTELPILDTSKMGLSKCIKFTEYLLESIEDCFY